MLLYPILFNDDGAAMGHAVDDQNGEKDNHGHDKLVAHSSINNDQWQSWGWLWRADRGDGRNICHGDVICLQDCKWADGVASKKPLHATANVPAVIQESLAAAGKSHPDPSLDSSGALHKPPRLYLTDCSMESYKQRAVHPETPGGL